MGESNLHKPKEAIGAEGRIVRKAGRGVKSGIRRYNKQESLVIDGFQRQQFLQDVELHWYISVCGFRRVNS